MKQLLTIALCVAVLNLNAQKTITKKSYTGKIYEQYQVDANGTKNGFYKRFFNNGFLETDAVYYKGKPISSKTYEYYANVRYLMHDATWDRNGKLLTAKRRDYINGEVGPLIQTAGLLANGKWSIEKNDYFSSYSEQYKGNDTVYVWKDKTKKGAVSKFVNDNRVYSKAQIALDEQLRHAWSNVQKKSYSTDTKNSNTDYHKALAKYYEGEYYDKQVYNFYIDIANTLVHGTNETIKSKIKDLMCLNDIDTDNPALELNVGEYGGLTISAGITNYGLFNYVTNQSKLELILDIQASKQ